MLHTVNLTQHGTSLHAIRIPSHTHSKPYAFQAIRIASHTHCKPYALQARPLPVPQRRVAFSVCGTRRKGLCATAAIKTKWRPRATLDSFPGPAQLPVALAVKLTLGVVHVPTHVIAYRSLIDTRSRVLVGVRSGSFFFFFFFPNNHGREDLNKA